MSGNQVGKRSVSIDDMLFAFGDLPAGTQIYKGKNYWTIQAKKPNGGMFAVRNRRLADALVIFVEGYEQVTDLDDEGRNATTDTANPPKPAGISKEGGSDE